jgi:hypothetical protein
MIKKKENNDFRLKYKKITKIKFYPFKLLNFEIFNLIYFILILKLKLKLKLIFFYLKLASYNRKHLFSIGGNIFWFLEV